MTVLKTIVEDNTGRCTITWFNQTYIKQHIKRGETYKFFGKAINEFNHFEMRNPVFDKIDSSKNTGKIIAGTLNMRAVKGHKITAITSKILPINTIIRG
jgi:ATP-dependent DNA helicase RecG